MEPDSKPDSRSPDSLRSVAVVDHETFDLVQQLTSHLIGHGRNDDLLAFARAWLHHHATLEEDVERRLPAWVQVVPCKYCGRSIFFAKRLFKTKGKTQESWLTVVPKPVYVEGTMLDAINLNFRAPEVVIAPHTSSAHLGLGDPAVKWIPHRVFCNQPVPDSPILRELYEATYGKEDLAADQAMESFVDIMRST